MRFAGLMCAVLGLLAGGITTAAGCGGEAKLYSKAGAGQCKSGRKWVAGNTGSPKMNPGGDCIDCHQDNAGTPDFSIAGTVYAGYEEPNDCVGVEGAEVVVTDDTGETVRMETNESGNFFLRKRKRDLKTPLRTEVRYKGETQKMESDVVKMNCASCHTSTASGGEPGRIAIPGVEKP